jgi:protein-S-isoprenylcysteine O-methyltransferase Ste14
MYFGLAFVYLGVAVACQSGWTPILLAVVLIVIQRWAIEPEEAFLEKRFGANSIGYKEKVRLVIKAVFEDHSRLKVRTRSVEEF